MRKLIWAAVVVLATSLTLSIGQPSFAKAGKAKQGHAAGKMGKLAQALTLTEDQKAKIKPILESTQQKVKAVKADTTLSPEASKAKMKAIRKDSMSQIAALLTPEQKTKLTEMRHHKKKAAAPTATPAG